MRIKEPTDEQRSVLQYDGNTVVTAKPGSGKTYTLVEKIACIIPTLPDYKGVVAISFTNKASDELKQRCNQRGILSTASFWGTIDKFYISQIIIPFASHLTGVVPEYEVITSVEESSCYYPLLKAENFSDRQNRALLLDALREGKIFLPISGETALFILENVPGAIKYLKARFSHIIIDEYQDCGSIQHQVFINLVENGLVGIAVGDINQAIYGFAKRFPKYLLSLLGQNDFRHFELSRNHRCHPSISEYSLCLYGTSKTIPEEKRVYRVCVNGNEGDIASAIDNHLDAIKKKFGVQNNNQIAVLCRGNATIQKLDVSLETPHKIIVETPLDIDNSDWGRFFRNTMFAIFSPDLYPVDYAEQLYSEDQEPEKYHQALSLCQTAFSCATSNTILLKESLISLAELVYPSKINKRAVILLDQILSESALLNSFAPASDDELNVMTIHKSKGLEFNIVFHMDLYKWVMPNEYVSGAEQLQDLNLHYVGVTRAIDACYIMNGTYRYRSKQGDYIKTAISPFLLKPGLNERRIDLTWD